MHTLNEITNLYNQLKIEFSHIPFNLDENNKIYNCKFEGGCNGNLKGICKLVEGKDAKEIASLLKGNTCGPRPTSCPDQLSKAIESAING
jgi:uncharacterized protein (TIGR03905 family)